MNKQAITFFSLFSLILVLSVYYVMIPPIETSDNTHLNQEVSLQEKLDEKRELEKEQQNDILASSSSSGEELNQALDALNENKEAKSIEAKVTKALNDLKYNNVFCEIDGNIIKISISKNDASKDDAVIVMECVLEICNQKYSPEIKFISE